MRLCWGGGGVGGAPATPSWGDEEFTSHTQEADVMHTCVHPWWPGCGWVRICQGDCSGRGAFSCSFLCVCRAHACAREGFTEAAVSWMRASEGALLVTTPSICVCPRAGWGVTWCLQRRPALGAGVSTRACARVLLCLGLRVFVSRGVFSSVSGCAWVSAAPVVRVAARQDTGLRRQTGGVEDRPGPGVLKGPLSSGTWGRLRGS